MVRIYILIVVSQSIKCIFCSLTVNCSRIQRREKLFCKRKKKKKNDKESEVRRELHKESVRVCDKVRERERERVKESERE